MLICPDCNHEAHDPGQCPKDNCGEAEVSHSDATKIDQTKVVGIQHFTRGESAIREVTHIKPRRDGSE